MDDFFTNAETIVEGKSVSLGKPAMKAIVNGCNDKSDVRVKKADFYHLLQGIYKFSCSMLKVLILIFRINVENSAN